MFQKNFFPFCITIGLLFVSTHTLSVQKKTGTSRKVFPVDPRYTATIEMDYDATKLIVEISVQTPGFAGFGISPEGTMRGADIFVGGVHSNGSSYFEDCFGRTGELFTDDVTNWELLEAKENGTHTDLKFSRLFDTGDSIMDVVIRDEPSYFIWAIGQTDRILYHGPYRGVQEINFFDL